MQMVFLNYRQSSETITKPQQINQDVVCDRPLTMFEVDANFKALSDSCNNSVAKYGLGVVGGIHDDPIQYPLSKVTVEGANDADLLTTSCFAVFDEQTTHSPNNKARFPVLSIANGRAKTNSDTQSAQIAIQNVNGKPSLLCRTKADSWSEWSTIVTTSEFDDSIIDSLKQTKIGVEGGTVNGPMNFESPINVSNIVINDKQSLFSGVKWVDEINHDAYSLNPVNESNFVGIQLTSYAKRYPNLSTDAINPTLKVGFAKDGKQITKPTSYIHTPLEIHGNEIASTGWVTKKINDILDNKIQADFDSHFHSVTTDKVHALNVEVVEDSIANTLKAKSAIISGGGPVFANVVVEDKEDIAELQTPTGNGLIVNTFTDREDDLFDDEPYNAIGRIFTEVDNKANVSTFIESIAFREAKRIASNRKDDYQNAKKGRISVNVDKDGVVTTSAPHPLNLSIYDNAIATTKWVVDKLKSWWEPIKQAIDRHFEKVENHLTKHDQQIATINDRLSNHDTQLSNHDTHLHNVDDGLTRDNNRLNGHDKDIKDLSGRADQLKVEINQTNQLLDQKVNKLDSKITTIKNALESTGYSIDFGELE